PRPLLDGPGGESQRGARRRRPAGAEASLGADARDGRARAGDRRHRHGQIRRRQPGRDRHRRRPGRQRPDQERRGRARAVTGGLVGGAYVAPPRIKLMLSARQELILRRVVEAYLDSGRPVPSKEVAERPEVEWGPSTVRAELAALEAAGYLTHPHTSAGRVPTDVGYRDYVDSMLSSGQVPAQSSAELQISRLRREVDEAMRETTAALAQVTDLVAMATA